MAGLAWVWLARGVFGVGSVGSCGEVTASVGREGRIVGGALPLLPSGEKVGCESAEPLFMPASPGLLVSRFAPVPSAFIT